MTHPREGFATSYAVELLFELDPGIDPDRLIPLLEADSRLGTPLHESYGIRIAYADAETSEAGFVIELPPRRAAPDRFEQSLRQSYSWDEARSRTGLCTRSITVRDVRASSLDFATRLEAFQRCLLAVLAIAPCQAIHWIETRQIVDPAALIAAIDHDGFRTFLGALNIRLFRITEFEDGERLPEPEIIMDTLGLSALGLDDLQCHFRRLEPQAVGHVLFDAALSLVQNGRVIHGGDELRGLQPGERWKCEMEDALVEPKRVVIDVDPGGEWSGTR